MSHENGDPVGNGSVGAADGSLADASMAVSTAETRTEMASIAVSDARDAAESAPDLDAVAARLDAFEARLASIEGRLSELTADLETLVERGGATASGDEAATEPRRLAADAAAVQRTADELSADLDSFERWVADPETRYRELAADVDAVEGSLAELAAAVEEVADERASGSDGDGVAWGEARLHHRVAELLLADVRAELADLRTWDDREGDERCRSAELDDRLDGLDARAAELGDRLDGLTRPEWEERFGEHVVAFEDATADLDPPIDWTAVQSVFEEHRPATGREES